MASLPGGVDDLHMKCMLNCAQWLRTNNSFVPSEMGLHFLERIQLSFKQACIPTAYHVIPDKET